MKRTLLVVLLLLALVAVASTASATAGTVVIVKTDAGGVGPTPPSDGGGTYYCGAPGTDQLLIVWRGRWARCRWDYAFNRDPSMPNEWNETFGHINGCGYGSQYCNYYHYLQ